MYLTIYMATKSKEDLELILEKLFPQNVEQYIVPKYSLMSDINSLDGVSLIVSLMRKIPDFELRKDDLEFLLITCNFIENMLISKKDKISKGHMVRMIYHELFALDPKGPEMDQVLVRIQFLIDHKKIKKISFFKKLWFCVRNAVLSWSFF
jgi:hypothetical protein